LLEHCKDVSGQRHKLGDSYIGEDGCNTCRCLEEGNACTKRMCPSENDEEIAIGRDTAYKCVDNQGSPHRVGEQYTHVDGCNTCTCLEAGGACTRKYCIKEPRSLECVDNKGNIKTERDGTYIGSDGCNKCICGVLGPICTEMLCTDSRGWTDHENEAEIEEFTYSEEGNIVNKAGSVPCKDDENKDKAAGSTWLTQDSCNICLCKGDGSGPQCTKVGCSERLARLVSGNGASINILSITSLVSIILMIFTM